MALQDNRQFVEILEKTGDLVRIEQPVDWDLEAGAIIRRSNEMTGPAILYENVKDYPKGYRILGGPIASFRRLAIALGVDANAPFKAILEEYGRRHNNPIKPVIVNTAPCKENVIIGDDIDLFHFPAPMIHEGDGGRYIGTWHVLVTKDPDSGWVNWGLYRLMLYDRKNMVAPFRPDIHGPSIFYQKYQAKGQPMPYAAAIGADPISVLTAGTPYGRWENECDYAGALRQQPVELIKCETNDLLVPAHAEIIIEGEILPDVWLDEGPFGEFTSYSSSPRRKYPAFRVKAITHRNNPILPFVCHGIPIDDGHIVHAVTRSYLFQKILDRQGILTTGVFVPPETSGLLIIVGLKTKYSNIATQVAKLLMVPGQPHDLIIVDADTNIYNLVEVMHSLATKCHPSRGIKIVDDDVGTPLVAFYSPEEKKWRKGAKAIFDCTFPVEWPETATPRKMTFDIAYPKDIRDKVIANWQSYGFK